MNLCFDFDICRKWEEAEEFKKNHTKKDFVQLHLVPIAPKAGNGNFAFVRTQEYNFRSLKLGN